MFTGIVAHLARVRDVEPQPDGGVTLRLFAPTVAMEQPAETDSICVNGVCLTLRSRAEEVLQFDVVPETLARSNLGRLRPGDVVNVELSLRAGDRLGGHFVYGHIDTMVKIERRIAEGQGLRLTIERPPELARFIVEKGSVALDGVSLTVASALGKTFDVAVIPETVTRTTLGTKSNGAVLNLEIDPVARYALASLQPYEPEGPVRSDELAWAYEI